MKLIPLEFLHFCRYVDDKNKAHFFSYFITINNEVEEISTKRLHKIADHNNLKNTLSFALCGDYSLNNKLKIFDALEFDEYLSDNPQKSNTKLAIKLDYMLSNIGFKNSNPFVSSKRNCISEKKLNKYLVEIEEIENSKQNNKTELIK